MVSDSSVERFVRQWADHALEAGRDARSWSDALYIYRERMIREFFEQLSSSPESEDNRPN